MGFVNAYGLTETSSTVALLGPDDHRDASPATIPRCGLGWARWVARSRRSRWRSAIRSAPLPAGEQGEIWVRGEQVSGEYLTATTIGPSGWFNTRDAGFLDAAGFLFVRGRLDDVIVRGGENLSPGEIEEVLLEHPAVEEAAVVGVPDPEWGEQVVAAVVLHEGEKVDEAELQDLVRPSSARPRTPERIDIRDESPTTRRASSLRRVLKTELADEDASA